MFLERHYKLLEYIAYEKKWFSLQEIAQTLNCSVKTVQRDLIQISDYLPDNWYIKTSSKKEVKLIKPISSSIESIQRKYFKHTLLFQAFSKLLLEDIKTITELASSLYIQNTKMRSVLLEMDFYLKQYNLTLKKRPLRIEGSETNLILMYYTIYLKSYAINEWPFHQLPQRMFTELLKRIEKVMGIKFYRESVRKMSFFLAVYFLRKKYRFQMPLNDQLVKDVKSSSLYKKIAIIAVDIFKKYGFFVHNQDIVIIMIAINYSKYYYQKKEIIKKNYLSSLINEDNQWYKGLKELIQSFETTFNLNLISDEEFVFYMVCALKLYVYKSNEFTVKNQIQFTSDYIKIRHKTTFIKIQNLINQWSILHDIKHHIGENEIANLTMHIKAIHMKTKRKNKKVILLLNEGESWDRYIKEFLNSYFNRNIEYLNISIEQLSKGHLSSEGISCIITDTPLEYDISSIPIILIYNMLTKRDLQEIAQLI